jgi:hypothetical protein
MRRAFAPGLVLLLAACSGRGDPDATATDIPQAVGSQAAAPAVESAYGTPVKDRVATLGLLNKRNNITQDIVLKTGEARRIGNVVLRLASCERTLPWERPAETGAFVQVFVEERADADSQLAWRKVFSGWLFKNAPSLNVVEHPVYDVWVKDCAMKFPGEEDSPASSASPSSAPKAAGSASPADTATPSASPAALPSPAAKAAAPKAPAPSIDL